tara:strand:+ start:359 stop:532 length:174 start_codon:yes stop_codon:yes gene_type:complete
MTWKIRKEFEGKTIGSINKPLNELTQMQIERLNERVRNTLFIKEKPKKQKSATNKNN